MSKQWSEQGIKPGFVSEDENSDRETDSYIISNDRNQFYSLVSLTDGEVITTATSVDLLKSMAEIACDSSAELVEIWSNAYERATDFKDSEVGDWLGKARN